MTPYCRHGVPLVTIMLAATLLLWSTLSESARSALKLMPQTSALVQLPHVEAQLIAAFCWSVDSLLWSEMNGCQWLMGDVLPDSSTTLHAMQTDQLDLMLQTSAFVQLLHTEAQLINAFFCSRESLLRSAVDACQWQKATPHQIPCHLHAHTSYWANFQCTHAAFESACETVP